MGSALRKPYFFQYICHRIPNRRSRSKGKVDDAERNAQHTRSLGSHQLTHTGDLEGSLFDQLRNLVKRRIVREFGKGGAYNSRPGNSHIKNHVRLSYAVESSRHERVVLWRVAKYNELCSADTLAVLCEIRGFLDNTAHDANRIHIDSGFRGPDVYR